jgi:hypothetical protein
LCGLGVVEEGGRLGGVCVGGGVWVDGGEGVVVAVDGGTSLRARTSSSTTTVTICHAAGEGWSDWSVS